MTFERIADCRYRLTDAAHGVVLDVSRLRRSYDNLVGELAVSCPGLLGTRNVDGVISLANFNLSDARARRERAQTLAANARTGKIDWLMLLETLCQHVLAAEREGTPAVVLSELPRPEPDEEGDIDGFRFPASHPTITFGDGGTLKSYFGGIYVGGRLALAGLRVALFDWELDQWTHRLRLERVFGAELPKLRYVRCERPLVHEVDRLARIVEREKLDFAIFDSCGFACDGPPEAAESALAYFRAVRQLGIGSLHIAHTTKNGDQAEQRPFGSAFWHNSARSTWFVKLAGTSADGFQMNVGLFNRKQNLGPVRPAIAFEISFDDHRTTFRRVEASSLEELASALPLWQRIRDLVKTGPKPLAAIAGELNHGNVDSLDRIIRRHKTIFTKITGKDGITRIALVERRGVVH